MSGVLFTNYRPVFVDPTTGEPLALGSIAFYENETSTPKAVYSDPDLAVSLGTTVELDAEGRSATPIYLSGAYSYELLDASDVQIDQTDGLNNVTASGFLALDPADGTDGQVASTDGAAAEWRTILEVPDPTGHSGKYVGTDGEVVQWTAFPTATVYDEDNLPGGITDNADYLRVGNRVIAAGSGTCPTSATTASTVSVTFPFTFASAPKVTINATVGPVTGENARCSMQALSVSTTGFTASAFAGAEDGGGSLNIATAVTFDYIAFGVAP